jgi:hypothetical protein
MVPDCVGDSSSVGGVFSAVVGLSFVIAQEDESCSEGVGIKELG